MTCISERRPPSSRASFRLCARQAPPRSSTTPPSTASSGISVDGSLWNAKGDSCAHPQLAYGLGGDNIPDQLLATGGIETPLLDGVEDGARGVLERTHRFGGSDARGGGEVMLFWRLRHRRFMSRVRS